MFSSVPPLNYVTATFTLPNSCY